MKSVYFHFTRILRKVGIKPQNVTGTREAICLYLVALDAESRQAKPGFQFI